MEYAKATPAMMSTVKRVAEKNHRRLDGANIAVVRRGQAAKRRGKTIAEDEWEKLKPKQREALIDHELCHCELDEKSEPCLRGHDLEEFAEIIERHGFWRQDYGENVVQEALLTQGIEVGTIK